MGVCPLGFALAQGQKGRTQLNFNGPRTRTRSQERLECLFRAGQTATGFVYGVLIKGPDFRICATFPVFSFDPPGHHLSRLRLCRDATRRESSIWGHTRFPCTAIPCGDE